MGNQLNRSPHAWIYVPFESAVYYGLGIHIQKWKSMCPLLKVNQGNFFMKAYKNQIEWHHSCCHGDSIAQFKVVEAQISAKRKLSPGRHQAKYQAQIFTTDYIRTLSMELAKTHRVLVSFCMKTAEMRFQKHAPTLDVAMVIKGGWRRLKINFLFWKLVHLSCQKVSSP